MKRIMLIDSVCDADNFLVEAQQNGREILDVSVRQFVGKHEDGSEYINHSVIVVLEIPE